MISSLAGVILRKYKRILRLHRWSHGQHRTGHDERDASESRIRGKCLL